MLASAFKAHCLQVLDGVRRFRTPVVITKKGRPVAKTVPPDTPETDVFGCMAGTARIVGDIATRTRGSRSASRRDVIVLDLHVALEPIRHLRFSS